jgi:glyoxylase-like metal-dependent hydrolase (beta-lactamase superfamily II)
MEIHPLRYGKIIEQGDTRGNGMVMRFQLPSGLEVFGLPTENFYTGDWDLGPTWNYAVMADTPFLVDAGRYGQGPNLLRMMNIAGINPSDLKFVLISHGHEDHDGGLAELVAMTDLKIKAHASYDLLVRQYPDMAPTETKRAFPAKCWHCFMPESFYSTHCLEYHRVLQHMKVTPIGGGMQPLGTGITTYHLPGHSPDCLAVILGEEAVIVGDILLPMITPWPTQLETHHLLSGVVGHMFPEPEALFGLKCYLRSLKQLKALSLEHPDMIVLPAHRLYYDGKWNALDLTRRVDELLEHHLQRCAAIIEIVSEGHTTVEQIVARHFKPAYLRGPGKRMATNEILSHCELMTNCGDLIETEAHRYEATGTGWFETVIRSSLKTI